MCKENAHFAPNWGSTTTLENGKAERGEGEICACLSKCILRKYLLPAMDVIRISNSRYLSDPDGMLYRFTAMNPNDL